MPKKFYFLTTLPSILCCLEYLISFLWQVHFSFPVLKCHYLSDWHMHFLKISENTVSANINYINFIKCAFRKCYMLLFMSRCNILKHLRNWGKKRSRTIDTLIIRLNCSFTLVTAFSPHFIFLLFIFSV